MKGKRAMKTLIRIMGCLALVSFLFAGMTLNARSKPTRETQKKERMNGSGWIGIMIQDVNDKIVRKEKLDSQEGAYVKDVVDDSPADSAGIQEGDVLVVFNEKKLFDSDDLIKIVHRTMPGTKANVVIIRDGQKKTLHVTVGKKKVSKHHMFGTMPELPDVRIFTGGHILGLQLHTLNEQLGEYFGAPNNEGVLVEEVEHEGAAEKAGFKAGDIIISVGKKPVDAVEKVQKELRKYDEGDKVEFEVVRKSAKKTLSLEMEEVEDVPHNFFFRKPHIRMFRTDPFDDAEMRLDMDDLQSSIDQARTELKTFRNDHKEIPHEVPAHVTD
jgi:C-terminal processing protease CtpA/Prc